jgi:hypothetical protein
MCKKSIIINCKVHKIAGQVRNDRKVRKYLDLSYFFFALFANPEFNSGLCAPCGKTFSNSLVRLICVNLYVKKQIEH